MESKNNNLLIIALLAIIVVMGVGYAAFTQQLTINGTATINSSWDVHMTQTGATATPTSSTGSNGSVTVNGGGLTATINAELISPGDTIRYVIPIENKGTIDAKLTELVLSGEGLNITGNTSATSNSGNIRFTVTSPTVDPLVAGTGTDNIIVVAEYVDKLEGNANANSDTASLTITMNYGQA